MSTSRRSFLKGALLAGAGFAGLGIYLGLRHQSSSFVEGDGGFGPLIADPDGILDLPEGFNYRVISRLHDPMSDGLLTPGFPDGMACFAGSGNELVLVRNHELQIHETDVSPFGADGALLDRLGEDRFFDYGRDGQPSIGGTTTLVIDAASRQKTHDFLSLIGTSNNCAGGPTPWGSWLSCEEFPFSRADQYTRKHGYVFEVPSAHRGGPVDPVPLRALGRFEHEAAAIDPDTGIVYLTEDKNDSLIYRLLPTELGNLRAGGKLQALALVDLPRADLRNWDGPMSVTVNQSFSTEWIDLENVDPDEDDLRLRGHAAGAAIFARGEGMWFADGKLYFTCTSAGPGKLGQIWSYVPSPFEGGGEEASKPGQLVLFAQPEDNQLLENCDNLTVAPWGDLFVCEDGPAVDFIRVIRPNGQLFTFAKNALSDAEFAGICFSPDGQTMFANMQDDHLTIAVWGPWDKLRA